MSKVREMVFTIVEVTLAIVLFVVVPVIAGVIWLFYKMTDRWKGYS